MMSNWLMGSLLAAVGRCAAAAARQQPGRRRLTGSLKTEPKPRQFSLHINPSDLWFDVADVFWLKAYAT